MWVPTATPDGAGDPNDEWWARQDLPVFAASKICTGIHHGAVT